MTTQDTKSNAASTKAADEVYISVDVEAAGPIPGSYSLLSLGACIVGNTDESFYAELKPINGTVVPEALAVSGFDFAALAKTGQEPTEVFLNFKDWIRRVSETGTPIFVGFNASFDWSFVNWYFHTFLGENPFGASALDIKAYYMGFTGCRWKQTTSRQLPVQFQSSPTEEHNALSDAKAQAEVFSKLRAASSPAKF